MASALLAAAVALIAADAAHAEQQQFDLVCKGERSQFRLSDANETVAPYAERISVDLNKGIFCLIGNGRTCQIQYLTADPYKLLLGSRITIDRVTGRFDRESVQLGNLVTTWSATCELAPFTPMGEPKF